MGNINISHYPFDYHTHFWGILPVRPAFDDEFDSPCLERAIKLYYTECGEALNNLDMRRRLFSLSLRMAFTTFSKWFDITEQPFMRTGFNLNSYNRGESFVENALIGWNLVAQKRAGDILPRFWEAGISPEDALAGIEAELIKVEKPIMSKKISTASEKSIAEFKAELRLLNQAGKLNAYGLERILGILDKAGATYGELAQDCRIWLKADFYKLKFLNAPASIYAYYDYFNDQMLAANEFLPFDDSYVARDAVKDLKKETDGPDIYCQTYLINETNRYYQNEGITHTQLSMGPKKSGPIYNAFNAAGGDDAWGVNNKILFHNTNHNVGASPAALYKFLDESIDVFNARDTEFNKRVIGVDFLGSETYIDFETLFDVINKFKDKLNAPLGKKTFTFRIHVGEGSGCTANNRSVFGQLCTNTSVASAFGNNGAYVAFINRLVNFRPNDSLDVDLELWPDVLNLMQKIFAGPYYDLRFNIFSEKTHDRVTTVAETNMLSLYHAATKTDCRGRYTYGRKSIFEKISIRLGHGQHARQYIHGLSQLEGLASGLKYITFDTNLGSNFITGSSSNIMSPGDYDRAEGIRNLTSFAPARYVMQAINAVFGTTALSDTLFQHAYPLLIGSDGQGVEHTNLERENVRGLVLSILRAGLNNQFMIDTELLNMNCLQSMGFVKANKPPPEVVTFLYDDAVTYWEQTVGPFAPGDHPPIPVSGGAWISEQRIEPIKAGTSGFEYYKAPEFDVRWTKMSDL